MADSLNNPSPSEQKLADGATRARVPNGGSRFTSWRDHFAAERRWFADTFSAEKMIEMLKQLAWVVPLTLLIWVYAEREQVTKETNETIPFELVSADPSRLVTLKPPQDSNVVVELEGPRARVQDVLQRLRGGEFPQGLRIEIDRAQEANRAHQLRTIALIANHDLFRHNGITVTRTQPDTINVSVDQIVEREARVVAAPGTPNLLEGTKFDPPMVKVRGPFNVLQSEGDGAGVSSAAAAQLVVYAHIPPDLLAKPGTRDAKDLTLSLPPPLNKDARVTITPAKVDATIEVRASDETWEMPSMTISLDMPKTISDKFTVDYNTSLANVTLIGPKDVIDEMKKPDGPKPYAQLRITIEDTTVGSDRRQRTLRFMDLPRGVRVGEKDEQRAHPFRLVPRSDVDP